jgi:hypothetical protein
LREDAAVVIPSPGEQITITIGDTHITATVMRVRIGGDKKPRKQGDGK